MKHADLPERWLKKLGEWILENTQEKRDKLSARDFPNSEVLIIKFEDNSEVRFEYAIAIEDPELREIGVFSEHCGYHIFPSGGTDISLIEKSSQ